MFKGEFAQQSIKKFQVVVDFDQVFIKEQTIYYEYLAYFLFLSRDKKLDFLKEAIVSYFSYKKNKDISLVYSPFGGCPVEVLDNVIYLLHANKNFINLIDSFGINSFEILSRNNKRIISKYLNLIKSSFDDLTIGIYEANEPEIKKGIYTGKVNVLVNNNNLEELISNKIYICGRNEKRILSLQGLCPSYSEKNLFVFGNL